MRYFVNLLIITFLSASTQAQIYNPNVDQALDDADLAVSYLNTFEQLGIKEPGSSELSATANWLVDQYVGFGYSDIRRDTFHAQGFDQQNIVVRKSGRVNDYVVIGSHYDTDKGPGVNDNGTGVSATLFAADILVDLQTYYTVYFMNFAGEEDGFLGSEHVVYNLLDSLPGTLRLMINLDQLGGTSGGSGNDRIYCERDELSFPWENDQSSRLVTDTLANLVKLYTSLEPVLSNAYSSDYIPFQSAGYVITGLFQYSTYVHRHTIRDSLNKVDTLSFIQAARAAGAAAIHFARVPKFIGVNDAVYPTVQLWMNQENELCWEPNGMPEKWTSLQLMNLTGNVLVNTGIEPGSDRVKISEIPGIYLVKFSNPAGEFHTQRLIIPGR
ncbi:MAG: M28 family peptidase [Bacteroidetes bacterium]|nr:M28 family peptidase [Bacteroidota bacterium]